MILTIPCGSTLYGTTTPDSDVDYKHIYLPKFEDILLGKRIKNEQITTGNNHSKNGADDEDKEYVAIQTFMDDFFDGQSYALEIAFGIKNKSIEFKEYDDTYFSSYVIEILINKFLTRDVKSMVGFAYSQAIKYGLKGNRLRAFEYFTNSLDDYDQDIKLSEIENLDSIIDDKFIKRDEYIVNEDEEYEPCLDVGGKIYPLHIKVSTAKRRAEKAIQKYGERSKKAIDSGVDWKSLHHALRVSFQTVELLLDGTITLPLIEYVNKCVMEVKLGKADYKEVVKCVDTTIQTIDEILDNTRLVEQGYAHLTLDPSFLYTKLPVKTDELKKEFNQFKVDVLKRVYKL